MEGSKEIVEIRKAGKAWKQTLTLTKVLTARITSSGWVFA